MSMHDCSASSLATGYSQQLDTFRHGYYQSFTRRADALFELIDTLLCAQGKVNDLAHLSLEPEHHRGYGALYDAINHGQINHATRKACIGVVPVPKILGPEGRERIVLAVDASNWLRPDAVCSPQRAFSPHLRPGRTSRDGPGVAIFLRGGAGAGATSWTALLDVVRLRPGDDASLMTTTQLRAVVGRLINTGQQKADDPEVMGVMGAGYDVTRVAWLLQDLPVTLMARWRSGRVFYALAGERRGPTRDRPPRHGDKLVLREATTHRPRFALRSTTGPWRRARSNTCTRSLIRAARSRTTRAPGY